MIVTHLSRLTAFITTSQPLLPTSLELPSQKPLTAFHFSESLQIIFVSALHHHVGPKVSFLIVLPEDMCYEVVNLRSRIGNLSFPLWVQGLLYLANSFSVLLLQIILTIDHLHATSLSPHSCTVGSPSRVWMVVSAGPRSVGVFSLTFFPFSSPFHFTNSKLNRFLYCSQIVFTLFFANLHHFLLEFKILLICPRPPSCPLLRPLSFRKILCDLSFRYPGFYRVMVPRVPHSDIIANIHVIISSSWPRPFLLRSHTWTMWRRPCH